MVGQRLPVELCFIANEYCACTDRFGHVGQQRNAANFCLQRVLAAPQSAVGPSEIRPGSDHRLAQNGSRGEAVKAGRIEPCIAVGTEPAGPEAVDHQDHGTRGWLHCDGHNYRTLRTTPTTIPSTLASLT